MVTLMLKGELTPAGSILANFLGVFGEAGLAELQLMQAKKEDVDFAKAA